MLRVPDASLSETTQSQLNQYQSNIDALSDYAERVAAADKEFKTKNRNENAAFREVRSVLASLCTGTLRCMYCEDSQPNQVEHIKPKSLYPEAVFVWENYLYACSPCNLGKLNKFDVYSKQSGQRVNVARPSKAMVVPPIEGDPLLINPRIEDPLEFLQLDIRKTFDFQPVENLNAIQHERAVYTIDLLGLNSRESLRVLREHAYEHYYLLLDKCVQEKQADVQPEEMMCFARSIKRANHATVWAEMKRQRHFIPKLQKLFAEAPESLNW